MNTELAEPLAFQEIPQFIDRSQPFPVGEFILVGLISAILVLFILKNTQEPYAETY